MQWKSVHFHECWLDMHPGRDEYQEVVEGALENSECSCYSSVLDTWAELQPVDLKLQLVAGWSKEFFDQLISNIKNGDSRTVHNDKWEPATWPAEAKGVGMTEAPRGALAHWIVIKDKKIENYQLGCSQHMECFTPRWQRPDVGL